MLYKIKLSATTDTGGDATTVGPNILAPLYAVQWLKGSCADGVDVTISTVNSDGAATILTLTDANADGMYFPRLATHDNAGAADGGTTYPLMVGAVKLTIASGGSAKTGSVILYYFD
jgi:hypothetical protein